MRRVLLLLVVLLVVPQIAGAVPAYPPDVNCKDSGREVQVVGSDPHKLDGDGNDWACEGYG